MRLSPAGLHLAVSATAPETRPFPRDDAKAQTLEFEAARLARLPFVSRLMQVL
jgi:hypothetical protein